MYKLVELLIYLEHLLKLFPIGSFYVPKTFLQNNHRISKALVLIYQDPASKSLWSRNSESNPNNPPVFFARHGNGRFRVDDVHSY